MNKRSASSYDTKEGIQQMIKTLHGLNELERERNEAGYKRRQRLHDFCILGRWNLDACGNFGKFTGEFIPKKIFPHTPDVLTGEEFQIEAQKLDTEKIFFTYGVCSFLPSADIICDFCRKPWTIRNCHDAVVVRSSEVISLSRFPGRQLWEVQLSFSLSIDAEYRMQSDMLICNSRFIDSRPNPEFPTLQRNPEGWLGEAGGITGQYVIQDGDQGLFNIRTFYHERCARTEKIKNRV